jgi:hypothetical protein
MDRKLQSKAEWRSSWYDSNITVISPKAMVKESWFLEAIADPPTYLWVTLSWASRKFWADNVAW